MANYSRNINEKELLAKIVRLFTDNPVLRDYCNITDLEAEICKKVYIGDKLLSELSIPNKVKKSQVKEFAAAPFIKVINKISELINDSYSVDDITGNRNEDVENEHDSMFDDNYQDISLDEFVISERTKRILKEHNITTIRKLEELDFDKLRFDKNYGVKTIFELQQLAGKLKGSRDILSIHRKTGKQ